MLHSAAFSASTPYRGEGQRSVGNLYHCGILTFLFGAVIIPFTCLLFAGYLCETFQR